MRGNEENVSLTEYELNIQGLQQKLCENFTMMLSREAFKRELPVFISKDWSNPHYSVILEEKQVFLGVKGECNKFYVDIDDGTLKKDNIEILACINSKADTRVILRMIHADKTVPGDKVVRRSDTDILILLLHHLHKVTKTVWMKVGKSATGNCRYINVI